MFNGNLPALHLLSTLRAANAWSWIITSQLCMPHLYIKHIFHSNFPFKKKKTDFFRKLLLIVVSMQYFFSDLTSPVP